MNIYQILKLYLKTPLSCYIPKDGQGHIQGVFETSILVWAPKFGAHKIFSGHFTFNEVLQVNLFLNHIRSKGVKKMCDCALKLHHVYIN